MNKPDALIILSHLKIQNANTISSPLTWGFPAMTAILGFAHALERKLILQYPTLKFGGVGVVCHQFSPQVYKSKNAWDSIFCLTRNPLNEKGETPGFVEEGRAHLELSLIIQGFGEAFIVEELDKQKLAKNMLQIAQTLRLAGGSILPESTNQAQIITWPDNVDDIKTESKKVLRRLLPGFVLVSREDLLTERTLAMQALDSQATALDALLEFSSLNFEATIIDKETNKVQWDIKRKPGWIVAIPVGYSAISELYDPGVVKNARDNNYPFQFVESIYSLGQWLSPHRIKTIEHIFWQHHVDLETGLYRCINNFKTSPSLLLSGETTV